MTVETTNIAEKVKKVWERKQFKENEYVQKVIFEKGPSVNLWNKDELTKDVIGKFLEVTSVYSKENNKGYQEYNTTDDSVISITEKEPSNKIINQFQKMVCPYCKKPLQIIVK